MLSRTPPGPLRVGVRKTDVSEPWNLLDRPGDVFCWRSRDSEEIWGGFGCAFASASLEACRSLLSQLEHTENLPFAPRCFGLVAFDPEQPLVNEWTGFPGRQFWIPRLLIRRKGTRTDAVALSLDDDLDLPKAKFDNIANQTTSATCLRETSNLSPKAWHAAAEEIRSRIEAKILHKAVLSRRLELSADKLFPIANILDRLSQPSNDAFLFACRKPESGVFFGASPECLFHLKDRKLKVDSLAGSRPRAKDQQCDRELREQLEVSDKDHREQQIVTDYVFDRLSSLCMELHTSATSVRDHATIRHLYTEISGTLQADITPETVLNTLHPTPAVCGMPTEAARQLISTLEPDSRGLYAGAIGWADKHTTEFAVAIRSGLIRGDKAVLFAGAGIVADSVAQNEYDECEWKLAGLRKALFPTL
jgi:isochorismate synthase